MGGPDEESKKPLAHPPDDYDEDSATEIGPSLKHAVRPIVPSRPPFSGAMRTKKPPPPLPARASVKPMRAAEPPASDDSVTEVGDGPPTLAGIRGSKTNLPAARYEPMYPDDTTTARRDALGGDDEDQTTRVSAAQIHALLLDQPPPSTARGSIRENTAPMPAARVNHPSTAIYTPQHPTPSRQPSAQPSLPQQHYAPPSPQQHAYALGESEAPQIVPLSRKDVIFPIAPTPIQTPGRAGPSLPPQHYPASPPGGNPAALIPGLYDLQSVPGIPIIPPLLPNGEAIALEPARFDPPSLAVLRGDVKLPYLGQPPSSKSLIDATDPQTQKNWIILAVVSVVFALMVAGVVAYLAAHR